MCFLRTVAKMNDEQRSAITFCVRNGFSEKKTIEMVSSAYGEIAVKKTVIYKWYNRFQEGRENIGDDARSGRPA